MIEVEHRTSVRKPEFLINNYNRKELVLVTMTLMNDHFSF